MGRFRTILSAASIVTSANVLTFGANAASNPVLTFDTDEGTDASILFDAVTDNRFEINKDVDATGLSVGGASVLLTGGRSLTETGTVIAADAELFARTCSIRIVNLATDTADANLNPDGGCAPNNDHIVTVTRIFCIIDTGEASITIDEVTRANTFGTGTNVDPTFNCTTGGTTVTAFDNDSIAAGSAMNVVIGTVTEDADVQIYIDVDYND